MNVAILYDAQAEADGALPDIAGVCTARDAVDAALHVLGHTTSRVAATADGAWQTRVRMLAPDVVFNLCEGLDGDASAEPGVAAALEALGIPFTGAKSAALALARRKDEVNELLSGAVPVPAWMIAEPGVAASWQDYPAIVKPAAEDAGIGIDRSAIAHEPRQLAYALDAASRHAPLLVQRFLDGIELVVAFVGGTPLPIAEVDYAQMPPDLPRVVGYAAKWHTGSTEDRGSVTRCPAHIDTALEAQALATAHAAWRAICNSGYARIDLRADAHEVLHVLDVNPNPDLAPDAGLARMAAAAGWRYSDLIDRILRDAVGDAVGIR